MSNLDAKFRAKDSAGKGLTKNDYSDAEKTVLANLTTSNTNYFDKHLLDNSSNVSKVRNEVYAHQAYNAIVGQYVYTVYMANEGTYDGSGNLTTGSNEGDTGQIIRMSKKHLIDDGDITFFTVATASSTWVATDLALRSRPQSPNIMYINATTLRVFFVALTSYGSDKDTLCYIDFNITTSTFGDGTRCRIFTKKGTSWVYAERPAFYDHYDWYVAGMPASGVSYPSNAIQGTVQDIHLASDFYKAFNGYYHATMNIGSGLDKNVGNIFMRTTDNGAYWTLYSSFNPLPLPGITGTDNKALWEPAIIEDVNNYYLLLRGASAVSPAKGIWRCVIPKTDLYTISSTTKISDLTNEKVHMFKANNKYYLILQEDNRYQGPNFGVRTAHGIYLCNVDFSTLTRVTGFADSNGAHTFGCAYLSDMVYFVYSTSTLRQPQYRPGGASWQNTTNIKCLPFSFIHLF